MTYLLYPFLYWSSWNIIAMELANVSPSSLSRRDFVEQLAWEAPPLPFCHAAGSQHLTVVIWSMLQ